jgi:hypothetical protein
MRERLPGDTRRAPPPAPGRPAGARNVAPPAGHVGTSGPQQPPGEVNGPKGPEPTRFGDWEKGGRCSDF